jgi:hypothetical protein
MHDLMNRLLLTSILFLTFLASGQDTLELAENGKTFYRIVIPETGGVEQYAI